MNSIQLLLGYFPFAFEEKKYSEGGASLPKAAGPLAGLRVVELIY